MSLAIGLAVPREAVRRRVVLWVLVLAVAFLGLFALGLSLLRGALTDIPPEAGELLTSMLTVLGLYIVSFLASLLAILLGSGAIASEVDSGLAAAVLARPLTRRAWLLQRWAALSGMVGLFVVATGGAVILLARLLVAYRPQSWPSALALMLLQAVVVLTLALVLSARLGMVAAGVAAFAGFGLAWLAGVIEFIGEGIGNQGMVNAGVAVSLVVPSDAIWRGASYFASTPEFIGQALGRAGLPFASTTPPAPAFVAWALLLLVAWVVTAVRWLDRRDL